MARNRASSAAAVLAAIVALGCAVQPPPIERYIADTWVTMTRSNAGLAVAAADPKFPIEAGGRWPVYIAASESMARVEAELRGQMPSADWSKIVLRQLPAANGAQGLLYLPFPYVVPGGRFNEMYGWDSYFIQQGLLRAGMTDLAKSMADNFLYEVRHYGMILNANRTYYLTRSQPPFLTAMVLSVYRQTQDVAWLGSALPEIESYYRYWTQGEHFTATRLSRYWDAGDGPAPEVISSERDEQGRTHYERAKEYYRTHDVAGYEEAKYYDTGRDELTPLFYKGDRSMRESGFDPSNRFGPFSVDIVHYNPVCLNSLLYLMEIQAAEIAGILGREEEAQRWRAKAGERARLVNELLWDDAAGLYFDYNFETRERRNYPFLTTFYPLWAGIASPAQASRVAANLPLFEQPGGLQTSTHRSGSQWDAPFGWAPLHIIAVEGLRRYGHAADADRIGHKFLSMVREDYARTGTIVEKYDVARRASELGTGLKFGYRSNEIGFGWTNAALLLLAEANQ